MEDKKEVDIKQGDIDVKEERNNDDLELEDLPCISDIINGRS